MKKYSTGLKEESRWRIGIADYGKSKDLIGEERESENCDNSLNR